MYCNLKVALLSANHSELFGQICTAHAHKLLLPSSSSEFGMKMVWPVR